MFSVRKAPEFMWVGREAGRREGDAKERCCPQETGFDICGSTKLLWGKGRESSGVERLPRAVGTRV